uniref:NTF2 domain-containing protein n=1 Tax=Bos taurus TaxID=9913 RepID=A0AAA9TWR9_BOVIN
MYFFNIIILSYYSYITRSSGITQRQYACWSEPVTSQQQQDRDSKESDARMDIQGRYAPYAIPSHHWRSSFQRKDQMHVNMETEQKPPERTMKTNRQDETLGSWFKIIIPFGIKYDEKWLMNLIQKKCSVPFTAVEFHYEKMQAQFFVENANVACALKNVSGKICNEDNEKISIFVEPCDAPQSVQKTLTSEKLEQIKVMQTQHKLCPHSQTHLFPQLTLRLRLETLSGSKCAVEAPKCLPMCKGSFFGSEELKSLILKFLQQYYLIHDYGDRQGLLGAYHEEACFSLAIPFQPKDPALSSTCAYFLDNRNMKILKDPNLRVQMMKHTKHDIVHTLCALPKTQHDFSSFVVDMCFQMEMMLCFSVNGVFKEVEGTSPGCVRAFTRTFIATPASPSR